MRVCAAVVGDRCLGRLSSQAWRNSGLIVIQTLYFMYNSLLRSPSNQGGPQDGVSDQMEALESQLLCIPVSA